MRASAPVAELVDALDSKSSSARSAGSIPARGTNFIGVQSRDTSPRPAPPSIRVDYAGLFLCLRAPPIQKQLEQLDNPHHLLRLCCSCRIETLTASMKSG